jgi:hypothetical protein
MTDEIKSVSDTITDVADEAIAGLFPVEQSEPAKATSPAEGAEDPAQLDDPTEPEGDGDAAKTDPETDTAKAPLTLPAIADDLKTDFAAFDAEGNPLDGIPHLVIEYKANGKVRHDRIDQVVKMAQLGVYNHEREQQLALQQEEMQETATEVIQRLETREAQLKHLLENEDAYERARETWMRENSPEKRATRAEAEARAVREQAELERMNNAGVQFYEAQVLPHLDRILDDFTEVEPDELMAKFQSAIAPVMKNGRVIPSAYPQIVAYVQSELRDWAQGKHAKRTANTATVTKEASAKVEAATIAAAKAKRQQAAASAPARTTGATTARATKPASEMSVQDAEQDALREVFAGLNLT